VGADVVEVEERIQGQTANKGAFEAATLWTGPTPLVPATQPRPVDTQIYGQLMPLKEALRSTLKDNRLSEHPSSFVFKLRAELALVSYIHRPFVHKRTLDRAPCKRCVDIHQSSSCFVRPMRSFVALIQLQLMRM
jgi:hypothetical protein